MRRSGYDGDPADVLDDGYRSPKPSGVKWVARNRHRLAYSYLGPLTARGARVMDVKRAAE